MSNFGFDPRWQWRRFQPPPEDLLGFGLGPVDPALGGEPGLSAWKPPLTGMAQPAPDGALPATEAAPKPWWERPPGPANVLDGGPEPRWPWLRVPTDEVPGFRLNPDDSVRTDEPGGRSHQGGGLSAWQPPLTSMVQPAPDGALPATEAAPRPWWERPYGPSNVLDGGTEPHWPWLRVATDKVPGFRLNPDGSVRTDEPGSDVRLMSGALASRDLQEQPNDVAGNGMTSPDVVPLPPLGAPPYAALSPALATSIVLPASAGSSVDLAALVARAAPVVAGAGSAAAAALPLLLTPTNTQSETTDLGDGLRARVRPGQRTVEIERRIDNGLLGTGIGATWKTLPVDAKVAVGRDGSVNNVIDHRQLNRVLGRDAPAVMDPSASAMARPPKGGVPEQLPPIVTDPAADRPDKPAIGTPPVSQSPAATKIDAKVLEGAKPKQLDPDEEERVLACRAVRASPGQPTISGRYDRGDAIDTAAGVRVPPGFPVPKGGYAHDPDYSRHWKGYRGELELRNRIRNALPNEIFVHYGNPAGDHGPDVLTIGPDRRFMEWESRYRSAPRRVGPNMARLPSLKYADAANYVQDAVQSGAVPSDVGDRALQELNAGNYNICTVGMGSAYDGWVELVRNHDSTGPRR
jgi:hypothetical protein